MWKNIVEPVRQQATIWPKPDTRWIPEGRRTHSDNDLLFSTATMDARTLLNIRLRVYYLSLRQGRSSSSIPRAIWKVSRPCMILSRKTWLCEIISMQTAFCLEARKLRP